LNRYPWLTPRALSLSYTPRNYQLSAQGTKNYHEEQYLLAYGTVLRDSKTFDLCV
jgi:hypothetical protein